MPLRPDAPGTPERPSHNRAVAVPYKQLEMGAKPPTLLCHDVGNLWVPSLLITERHRGRQWGKGVHLWGEGVILWHKWS